MLGTSLLCIYYANCSINGMKVHVWDFPSLFFAKLYSTVQSKGPFVGIRSIGFDPVSNVSMNV